MIITSWRPLGYLGQLKMKEVAIPDDGGDTIACMELDGHILPKMPDLRAIEGLRSVTIHDDDVLICTYPKSGTHWVFEIARELLTGEITNDSVTMASIFMEMTPEENYVNLPRPRILSSHVLLKQLPVDVLKKKIKIICVLRNPKDIAVSYFNFIKAIPRLQYNGQWQNFFRPYVLGTFMYGSWFDYVRSWETVKKNHPDLPILTLFYEDIKQNQTREMAKICEFLGVNRSDEFLSRVCQNTSMGHMKSQKKEATVFRKGHIGDWKNWFTVAQNEWFDQLYQEKMKDFPFEFKFTDKEMLNI